MVSGDSANAPIAASKTRRLIGDFIFEVADSGGETTVDSHVGVANEAETQFEVERFVKRLLLKDAGANHLAGNCDEDFVLTRGEDVYLRNLRFLMKLLRAELDRFPRAMILRLLQRGLKKHLPQQIRVVEILRVTLKKSDGGKFSLLRVQILRLRKLKQRADVIGLRRVNDDNPFALLELADEMVAVKCRERSHGDGDEKPEPRQPVTLREKLCGIETLARKVWCRSAFAGGCFTRLEFGGFHKMSVVVAFALGDEFADGFVAGDVIARPATGGTRRQARASDDDCPGAAVAGCR